MSPQLHEGPSVEGLSLSMLTVGTNPERIAGLQRMVSGFSHRCRNSLNGIKMSLYLVRREQKEPVPSEWLKLEQTYLQIERLFDQLQVIYRPMTLTTVRSPLGPFLAEQKPKWRTWLGAHGRTLRFDPPSQDLPGDFDPIHLTMGLDAVVAWRAEVRDASRHPRLSWQTGEGFCEVSWEEPGTPLAPDGPAGRDRENRASARVDSLALPLLARIVAAHGGQTELGRDPGRGFGLKLRWPRFQSQSANP